MEYLSYIKSSTSWVCPKTGIYKIIAVGGGSGAAYVSSSTSANKINGGTTSFGTYLAAEGGQTSAASSLIYGAGTYGGEGGYNIGHMGGDGEYLGASGTRSQTLNGGHDGGQGKGFGAGGGFKAPTVYSGYLAYMGFAGDVALGIMSINAGTVVPVTVGSGGTPPANANNTVHTSGKDGVVIIEYLGAEV